MKNKKIFIIVTVILVIAILSTIVLALFSDLFKKDSSIRIGEIKIRLEEDWPEPGDTYENEDYDEFGIKLYEKNIKGVSEGDLPAYVRIRCIPVVEYYYVQDGQTEGAWITAPVEQDDITLRLDGENWIYQDGYYYYKNIVKALQETDNLNIKWQIDELPSEISAYQIRTDVRVMLEYAQTTNNKWKDIFNIQTLPEGVEQAEY